MSSSEVKVGAVTLGGAAILAAMITFLGTFSFGSDKYDITIDYPQVGGLMAGNMVRYAGVQVGTVKGLTVNDNGIEVVAEINDNVQIPQEATFSIGADGILGEKFVDIQPPPRAVSAFLEEGDRVKGTPGGGFDTFMSASGEVLKKVENIADALDNVFGDPEVQQSLREGFLNMKDISANMNAFTKVMADVAVDNQQQINVMVKQLSEMSARMNETADSMQNIIAEVDKGHAGQNFAVIVENMAKTSARIEEASKLLEKVASDPQTEDDLKATLHNAREASEKANRMLGVLETAEISADVTHSVDGGEWRSNLGVTLRPQDDTFFYLGGYDLGDSNKLDLQFGKELGAADVSMGAMQGEFGVGLGYDIADSFRLYTQVYDFDDTKVKLGGELKINDNFSLLGEQSDLRHGSKNNTYVGVRTYF